jgi:hypothetical protein
MEMVSPSTSTLRREPAVHGVVTHQVSVGLDRAEIVDGDDFDVGASGFVDGAHDVAADTAKSVDGNFEGHGDSSVKMGRNYWCCLPP